MAGSLTPGQTNNVGSKFNCDMFCKLWEMGLQMRFSTNNHALHGKHHRVMTPAPAFLTCNCICGGGGKKKKKTVKCPYWSIPGLRYSLNTWQMTWLARLFPQWMTETVSRCKTASGIVHSVDTFRHLIEEVNRSMMEKQTGGKEWRGATGGLDG